MKDYSNNNNDADIANTMGYWKAMVGRIDREAETVWASYIDVKLKQGVTYQLMREAIDRIGNRTDSFKTPNLSHFKKELGGAGDTHSSGCDYCEGQAPVVVFNEIMGKHRVMVQSPYLKNIPYTMPKNEGEFYSSVVPCSCCDGNDIHVNRFGYFVFGFACPKSKITYDKDGNQEDHFEYDGFTMAKKYIDAIKKQEKVVTDNLTR